MGNGKLGHDIRMSDHVVQHSSYAGVVVVGSANIDLFYEVDRFAAPNETMHARSLCVDVGGKGLNQAIAAARSGIATEFIGAVGTDPQASLVRECLREHGIALTGLREIANQMTGSAAIMVSPTGDNMITLAWGANAYLDSAHVVAQKRVIERAKVLIVQGEIKPETSKAALEIAHAAGVFTILNPAPVQPEMAALLELCDVVTPNETEAAQITGVAVDDDEGAEMAVRHLLSLGVRNVIMTRGSRGYILGTEEKTERCAAYPVDAVDTTGAGDVFNGVLASSIASGMRLDEAANRASLAASISVQRRGAMRSAPSQKEIEGEVYSRAVATARA